jgi:hypothetical protein
VRHGWLNPQEFDHVPSHHIWRWVNQDHSKWAKWGCLITSIEFNPTKKNLNIFGVRMIQYDSTDQLIESSIHFNPTKIPAVAGFIGFFHDGVGHFGQRGGAIAPAMALAGTSREVPSHWEPQELRMPWDGPGGKFHIPVRKNCEALGCSIRWSRVWFPKITWLPSCKLT